MKEKISSYSSLILILIIGVHVFLLTRIIFFPYPELFVYSYLTKQGLIPYKQIFDQHFPGIIFFPLNLATLGIDTPEEARILHLGIISLTHLILFIVSRHLFKSSFYALVSSFLYLIWQPFFEGYVFWIDSMVVPLFLLAYYFFLLGKKDSLFYSGLSLGISLLFKQVVMPLIILVAGYLVFLDSPKRIVNKAKSFLKFLLGITIPVFILVLWLTSFGIWEEFIQWTIIFNITTFARMGRKYPVFSEIIKLTPLFATAALAWFYLAIRKKSKEVVLLGIFLLGTLFFAYARFDFVHFQPAIPFVILTTVYGLKSVSKRISFIFGVFYIISIFYLFIPFYRLVWRDEILFFGKYETSIAQKVLQFSKKNDVVFAMATTPHLYYLTQTLPPGRVFAFPFPWFMKEAEDKILNGIIAEPPKVIVREKNAQVQEMNLVDFMPRVNDYVDKYYKVVDNVDAAEILIPI